MHYYPSKIKEMRLRLGLSTSQLAHLLGVNQSTVVRAEKAEQRGVISLETLERMARAMDCQLIYKLDFNGEVSPKHSTKTFGLRRMRSHKRPASAIADSLSEETVLAARKLTPEQRFARALELSDLAMKLNLCSKQP